MDNYLGEIRMFIGNYAPENWLLCNGQLLPVKDDFYPLFTIIGNRYGGDGKNNFALPNLQSRIPVHAGQGAGLPKITLAEASGTEWNYLSEDNLPPHRHILNATTQLGNTTSPANAIFANTKPLTGADNEYGPDSPARVPMNAGAIGYAGGKEKINNVQPFFTVSFIIALKGIFPTRP